MKHLPAYFVILVLGANFSFAQVESESSSAESALEQEREKLVPHIETVGTDQAAEAANAESPYNLIVAKRLEVMGYYNPTDNPSLTLSQAIKNYQESQELEPTGIIDTSLLFALGFADPVEPPPVVVE